MIRGEETYLTRIVEVLREYLNDYVAQVELHNDNEILQVQATIDTVEINTVEEEGLDVALTRFAEQHGLAVVSTSTKTHRDYLFVLHTEILNSIGERNQSVW